MSVACKIAFWSMPPQDFTKAVACDGNEAAIKGYYSAVFDNPDMMSTIADHQAALDLLPITPLSVEGWSRIYHAALAKG